ncbi:MAG: glycosyltransferase family 4 protein [Candidatus Hydrogenedentes bacterium]|nr:glycosyltransferase family 4 protein [Candidatus Hydrogenedentota bacterium]
MTIGIDAHVIGTRAGGNESYMRNLLRALVEFGNPSEYLAFIHSGEETHCREEIGAIPTRALPGRSSYVRVPLVLPYLARKLRLDLLHVQYTAPPWCPCPYIVSMHDIVALRLPESMPYMHRHRLQRLTPRTLRRAARVFVLTEAIRDDIVRTYSLPPEKFDVVQPAIDEIFRPVTDTAVLEAMRKKYALPPRFVFYVGLLQPRKNLARLAQAFAQLRARGLDQHLVIAGKPAWLYDEMLQTIHQLGMEDRLHFTDYIPQEDLPALFSMADAFAYVSLYEGFGIPVLEALACGTPTLASTDPALVEVAGGAAVHAEPHSVDAIAAALETLLTDQALRQTLREAGPCRAATFTLERMARQAIAGYKKALS